jgi:hypothetical protein
MGRFIEGTDRGQNNPYFRNAWKTGSTMLFRACFSEAFVMAGQIPRLTSQHRIFVLQCAQTISQVNCARKVFVRDADARDSAEPHFKRGLIHGWNPSTCRRRLITISGEIRCRYCGRRFGGYLMMP